VWGGKVRRVVVCLWCCSCRVVVCDLFLLSQGVFTDALASAHIRKLVYPFIFIIIDVPIAVQTTQQKSRQQYAVRSMQYTVYRRTL